MNRDDLQEIFEAVKKNGKRIIAVGVGGECKVHGYGLHIVTATGTVCAMCLQEKAEAAK